MAKKNTIKVEPTPAIVEAPAVEAPVAEAVVEAPAALIEDTPPDNIVAPMPVAKKDLRWPNARLKGLASNRAFVAFNRAKAPVVATSSAVVAALTAKETELRDALKAVRVEIAAVEKSDVSARQRRACDLLEARLWRDGYAVTNDVLAFIESAGDSVYAQSDANVHQVSAILGSYTCFDRVGKTEYSVSDAMRAMAADMRTRINEIPVRA